MQVVSHIFICLDVQRQTKVILNKSIQYVKSFAETEVRELLTDKGKHITVIFSGYVGNTGHKGIIAGEEWGEVQNMSWYAASNASLL